MRTATFVRFRRTHRVYGRAAIDGVPTKKALDIPNGTMKTIYGTDLRIGIGSIHSVGTLFPNGQCLGYCQWISHIVVLHSRSGRPRGLRIELLSLLGVTHDTAMYSRSELAFSPERDQSAEEHDGYV